METTCAILDPWSGNSDSSKVGLLKVGLRRNSWDFAAWEARTHQTEWLLGRWLVNDFCLQCESGEAL